MQLINHQNNTNPFLNLALEEHILRNFNGQEDYFLFYENQPSIITGKHQNILEEINPKFAKENHIPVIRRISGGGTVFHTFGNLNFSFITQYDKKKVNNYAFFNQPIVDALQKLGVQAHMNQRNDIIVQDKKISGNAQFSSTKMMISHGTLLFDAPLDDLRASLKTLDYPITSKSVKSVKSSVANITEFLPNPMSKEEFKTFLLQELFQTNGSIPTLDLSKADWQAVEKLAKTKYQSWAWNYGRSPAFELEKETQVMFGNLKVNIKVKEGAIEMIEFYKDGFLIWNDLTHTLIGLRYEQNRINTQLREVGFWGDWANQVSPFLCDIYWM
jgi:lipoate---protein ligase